MTDSDAVSALTYLVSCAVNGAVPERARVDAMDLPAVYREASRQMLTAPAAAALADAGVHNAAFVEAHAKAIRKAALLNEEFSGLRKELEAAKIWYLPLKGIVLQNDYPRFGMRQMSDVDVLIDASRAGDVRRILEARGFTTESFDQDFHDVYQKLPVCSFEIHTALFSPVYTPAIRDYYGRIEEKLLPDPGWEYGRRLSDEDMYLYLLAHEHKHYTMGGTGLRSLLDVYVFLRRHGEALDRAYLAGELEALGLTGFEEENRALAFQVFGGGAPEAADSEMLRYMAVSGVYGREQTKVSHAVERQGVLRYVFQRAFLPMFYVKKAYPWFYRHKAALPLLPFYRLWLGLGDRRDRMKAELTTILRTKRKKK